MRKIIPESDISAECYLKYADSHGLHHAVTVNVLNVPDERKGVFRGYQLCLERK